MDNHFIKYNEASIKFVSNHFTMTFQPGFFDVENRIEKIKEYNSPLLRLAEYIDFNLSWNINYSVANNSILLQQNNHYTTQNAGIQFKLTSKKGWFIQNDILNQVYSGLSDGYNQNYWLWNAAAGKKFLKKQSAEIKLSVVDLLKQNRSITRTVSDSYIEDVQNQVLTQYFMLTFSYKLKNFGTPPANNQRGNRQRNTGGPDF